MKVNLESTMLLKLTPQFIQALKLLQYSTLRLEQVLRQELATNPLLEEVEGEEEEEEEEPSQEETEREESEEELELSQEEVDWEKFLEEGFDFSQPQEPSAPEEEVQAKVPVYRETLYDHLLGQLRLKDLSQEELEIGEFIIGNIDDDGYLSSSLEMIATILNKPLEKCQKLLSIIQTLDPAGVGARDLRECLLIQVRELGIEDELVKRIIGEYLHLLDRKTPTQLARKLKVPPEGVQMALEKISRLSPKPALAGFASPAAAIYPDIIVKKVGDDYEFILNDGSLPRLRVNRKYRELLKKSAQTSRETKKYIQDKLNAARWLVNALQQRRSTMLNVARSILSRQRDFLERGVSALKPLIMSEVAQEVGVHLSTVSRVVNDKWIQTPQGMFELRSFFGRKVEGEEGGVSTQSLLEMIRKIVEEEDPSLPLNDSAISAELEKKGIHLARRTVAKYREQLKILPARFRMKVGR